MRKLIITGVVGMIAGITYGDVLNAVADTFMRDDRPGNNYGTLGTLDVRQNDTAPRDWFGYVRFDLSGVTSPITGANFSVTQAGGDTAVNGRFRVLGLNNVAGNTDQNWGETALTWSGLGSEFTQLSLAPTAGDSPFDIIGGKVTDFEEGTENITETVSGGIGSVSGSALASWLESRRLDGGVATLIVDFPAGASDKTVNWASRENATLNGPSLEVIPEPATLGLVAVFGSAVLFVRRRFMI